MRIRFTKAPTFTKSITAAAVFAIAYQASYVNLPSCNDPAAMAGSLLGSGGECIERQSYLHTAFGWLALICLVTAALLLLLKHKDAILGQLAPAQQSHQAPPPPPQADYWLRDSTQVQAPTPVLGRASSFCAKCGTRIIAGDRFCQGCGITVEPH